MSQFRKPIARTLFAVTGLIAAGAMNGCEVDSFMDPSRTGRFEFTPTTIPILDRLGVIEGYDDPWSRVTQVTPEDLMPSDLSYRLSPGDVVVVEVYELQAQGEWSQLPRRVDSGGKIRLPRVGDLHAAGKTAQEFQDDLRRVLQEQVIQNPEVNVVVEQGGGYYYTVDGNIQPGVFTLQNPDLRLRQALALAGGAPITTKTIYIIREVPISDDVRPFGDSGASGSPPATESGKPVDVDDLINRLDDAPTTPPSPGMVGNESSALVDVQDLEPVRVNEPPKVDIEQVTPPGSNASDGGADDAYIYDAERGVWVKTGAAPGGPMRSGISTIQGSTVGKTRRKATGELILERIIEVDYERLKAGDSRYNIVVRPNDQIYVKEPPVGVVYVEGEILRPGVFNLPPLGKLTLSRAISAAGGFGAIAMPERVDLTRVIGRNREATLRVNIGAIRQRTEPDILLKADDHIIVGTNFIATPLAIIRNGFRMTYGFGFLLDRNFGNDVFGPPPESNGFN